MERLSLAEQETTINVYRDDETAEVYTSDQTMITKLDKMVEKSDQYRVTKTAYYPDGGVLSKTYEFPKRLLSFRANKMKRELTEEEKQRSAEALREWRKKKKEGESL